MDATYLGVRYPGRAAQHGHVESYFVKANDPKSRRALWLKSTIYASDRDPRAAVAEAWAIAFDGDAHGHVAVKSTVPFERARFGRRGLDVEVDACVLTKASARGALETAERKVEWDLRFESRGAPLIHFPRASMYEGPFPTSKLVSPMPDLRVSGDVVVNGERWTLDAWPGLLGHNWGRRHAFLYGWGHCNVWGPADGTHDPTEDLVLEGVSARVKVGPVLAPMTTLLCVRYRGVRYDLNSIADLVRSSGSVSVRRWHFRGGNSLCKIDGELWGETDDFVGLHYENPDGTLCYCLNTKIASARIELTVRGRAPLFLYSRAAALEIGTQDPAHGVRMYV